MTVDGEAIPDLLITNVNVLAGDVWLENTRVQLSDGRILAIGADADEHCERQIDGRCGYLVPGMVDLHGDAFERHITPRTGTLFPLDLALAANDASLVANGITTFFYSITDGFEPGPRSRQTVRELLEKLEALAPRFRCQAKVHIRHEQVNTDDHDELVSWLENGRVHLLSLNDHLPLMDNERSIERYLDGLRRRVAMTPEETQAFLHGLQERRQPGAEQIRELAQIAHKAGVSLASHDDQGADDVALNIKLETAIAEFPMDAETAIASRGAGISVLMGAPNLVRGGSHVGAISVRDAIVEDLVDILCSDYHYPSLFRAPFLAAEQGLMSLPEAWKLVSENPAKAAGMGNHKGMIAPGYDADLLLLDQLDGLPLSIRTTVVAGVPVLHRD